MPEASAPRLDAATRDALRTLARYLAELGFDETRLRERLGALTSRTTPADVAVAQRRLGDDALALAAGFWYLGTAAPAGDAGAAIGPVSPTVLEAGGLVTQAAGLVSPTVRIVPVDESLVAHDFDRGGPLASDHVVGIGAATRTLASLTPRGPVARVLDLGTGNGVQALLAAPHADAIVATDINPRAAWLTHANAALNGVEGIDVRVGDGFAPVGDERFGLIVANPPFVVSPDQALTFRDTRAGGEAFSRSVVRGAAERLEPSGTACVLANWVVREGSADSAAAASWVADLDCDSLILHHDTLDPVSYAQRWMLRAATGEPMATVLDRWLHYYRAEHAAGIASGALILRKTGAPARVRITRMRRQPRDGGEHVERILAAFGRFSGPVDDRLAEARFALVEPHELEQRLTYDDGVYRPDVARLRLRRSAGVEARLPADMLEALFAIDGERPLGTILDAVAAARGEPPASFRARAMPRFLELFERGFLAC